MTEVGRAYGEALYDLCRDEGLSDAVLAELLVLEISFGQTPPFIRILSSPALSKAERCGIVDAVFRGRLEPYLLNFIKILTAKGYVRHFSDCCKAYRNCYNKDHNILTVTATTATALTKDQVNRLTEKLGAITGKTVQLVSRIDTALIGGVRLDYDGKRLDGTIANRMESIRIQLKNLVL